MSADPNDEQRFLMCDDCYGGCFVGDCKDPRCECPECGGLLEQSIRAGLNPRCPHCGNYPDTPGHFYGCPKAAGDDCCTYRDHVTGCVCPEHPVSALHPLGWAKD